eukprot:XP_016664426.1 PREDICTED: uncharacterized protein LOC107885319 [Acyrthosiphon pisum]
MTTFYELYEIKTINDKNDDIVPSVNNKKRKLDTITRTDDTPETSDSNNENNITTFNHNDGTPEISVDTNKINRGELKEYPLNAFVLNYLPNNDKEYLRTTSAFCKNYSINSFF